MKKTSALILILSMALCMTSFAGEAAVDAAASDTEETLDPIAIITDALYDVDESRFTEAEYEFIKEDRPAPEEYHFYTDNEGQVDILTVVEPNTEGFTINDFITTIGNESNGCSSFSDFYGKELGAVTFLTTLTEEPMFYLVYAIIDNDNIYSKIFMCHTKEIQLGDTNVYMYIPKLLEKVDPADDTDPFSASLIGCYEGISSSLADMYIYKFDTFDYEYEKAGWKYYSFQMIDEERFNELCGDRLTLDGVREFYNEILGDVITEHKDNTIDGVDYSLNETLTDCDGVAMTSVYIDWIEDGSLMTIYLCAPAEHWPNIGEAMNYAIHRK